MSRDFVSFVAIRQTMQTDQQLLHAITGSPGGHALDELVARHSGLVHASILRRVRNRALAEDATQAVFLVLTTKAHTLTRHASITGWLLKTARYAAVDVLRQEATRRRHERTACTHHPEATFVHDEHNDQLMALDDALATLAGNDREAILLRFYQEASYAQVAMALGTTEQAARKRITRALQRLHKLLSRRGTMGLLALPALLLLGARQAAAAAASFRLHPLTPLTQAVTRTLLEHWLKVHARLLAGIAAAAVVLLTALCPAPPPRIVSDAVVPEAPPSISASPRSHTLLEFDTLLPDKTVVLAYVSTDSPTEVDLYDPGPAPTLRTCSLILAVSDRAGPGASAPLILPDLRLAPSESPHASLNAPALFDQPRASLPTLTILPPSAPPPAIPPGGNARAVRILAILTWRRGLFY